MVIKYDADIDSVAIQANIKRLTNQIYKLLPNREEGGNWQKPLATIIEELAGMDRLLYETHETLFCLMSKLEGLYTLTGEDDFFEYRRTIFDCLNLISELKNKCQD